MNKKKKLQVIAEAISRCRLCKKGCSGRAVPGEGNPDAGVVFIGEAPGREEARTGRPFVGRSGLFLRSMIRQLGLSEDDVFITSPVHYRPLRGAPSQEMISHGTSHLVEQLDIIRPCLVVLLGATASRALLGRSVKLEKEHGSSIPGRGYSFFLTVHPAFAIRFPEGRKKFSSDFRRLRKLIANSETPSSSSCR